MFKCTIGEIEQFFLDKEDHPSPLTEKLVKAGYQQVSGGYIDRAKRERISVDYKHNTPSQYWHLMSYCKEQDPYKTFPKSVVCGELLFWMAEISNCVSKTELELLLGEITSNVLYIKNNKPYYDRKKWNNAIHKLCFDSICSKVCISQEYSLDGYKPLPRFERTCCERCVHFHGKEKGTCPAYPNGIPDKFAIRNANDFTFVHCKIEKDQVGTTMFDVKIR